MRDITVALAFVVIMAPTTCFATSEGPPDDRPADASLAWVDCGKRESPGFQIEVWRDGRVKFIGSEQVRHSDEKIESYDLGASKKVLNEIHELSRMKFDVTQPQHSPDDLPFDKQLCVLAKSALGGRHREGLVNVSSRARIPRALKAIEKGLGVNERICPLRSAGSELAIGGSDYCDEPLLVFVDPVATACYSYREFKLYPNHVARQSASLVVPRRGSPAFRKSLADSYYALDATASSEIIGRAKSLTPINEEIEDGVEPTKYFESYGTQLERKAFSEFLARRVGFAWVDVPSVTDCGGTAGAAFPMLHVYLTSK